MKKNYIQRLHGAMVEAGVYDELYIQTCIKYAELLLNKDLPVIFDWRHIDQILQMEKIQYPFYTIFTIRGKRKERQITAPSLKIKARQRWILDNILKKIPVSDCCHGFIEGRSIVTNAERHIGKKYILSVDIEDFFPSITKEQIKNIFNSIGYSVSASNRLADICCFEERLPQGAPTSPYLANLTCLKMDEELLLLAQIYGLEYTRYADDMTFSGDIELTFLISLVKEILLKHNFNLNGEKTRVSKDKERKMVTGLIIKEDCLRIPKSFKRKLKQEIYYCKKYGVSNHLENISSSRSVNFREYLYGKAYYIKMVEPEIGEYFLVQLDSISW